MPFASKGIEKRLDRNRRRMPGALFAETVNLVIQIRFGLNHHRTAKIRLAGRQLVAREFIKLRVRRERGNLSASSIWRGSL